MSFVDAQVSHHEEQTSLGQYMGLDRFWMLYCSAAIPKTSKGLPEQHALATYSTTGKAGMALSLYLAMYDEK